MTQNDDAKLDRVWEKLVRMDEKLTMWALQIADHEGRLRAIESKPPIRWRDIGAVVGACSGVAIVAGTIIGVATHG